MSKHGGGVFGEGREGAMKWLLSDEMRRRGRGGWPAKEAEKGAGKEKEVRDEKGHVRRWQVGVWMGKKV